MTIQDPIIIHEHIARSIKRRIEDAGYKSVEQFSHENGLVKSTIYRAVSTERSPRMSTLVEIANALEIPLQDLLDLDKINPKRKQGIAATVGKAIKK